MGVSSAQPLVLSVLLQAIAPGLSRQVSAGPARSGVAHAAVDTRIENNAGSSRVLLATPPQSDLAILHMELCGNGNRPLVGCSLRTVRHALDECTDRPVVCVVQMRRSRGASLLSLPAIARFMLTHRRQLEHIFVLEASGLALAAVRTVERLSRHDRLCCFRTRDAFEAACEASGSPYHRLALKYNRWLDPEESDVGVLARARHSASKLDVLTRARGSASKLARGAWARCHASGAGGRAAPAA